MHPVIRFQITRRLRSVIGRVSFFVGCHILETVGTPNFMKCSNVSVQVLHSFHVTLGKWCEIQHRRESLRSHYQGGIFCEDQIKESKTATHRSSTNWFYTHSVLLNLFNTQWFLHRLITPQACYIWPRSCHIWPIQHAAILHTLRYSTRRFCTVPNTTRTDSTRPQFNTTRFYTSLFLYHHGPAPRWWSNKLVEELRVLNRFCTTERV